MNDFLQQIVGGENVSIDDYPWVALLRYLHRPKNIESWGCGGCYIGGKTVLTAAHCVDDASRRDLGDLYVSNLSASNEILLII